MERSGYDKILKSMPIIWAKFNINDSAKFHPLVFHMLDTANVAGLLWEEHLAHCLKTQVASWLHISSEEAEGFIRIFTGLHDIGKASAFQYKIGEWDQKLAAAGLGITNPHPQPHGYVTELCLAEEENAGWEAQGLKARKVLARLAGGHHGRFAESRDLLALNSHALGGANWRGLREQLLKTLVEIQVGKKEKIIIGAQNLSDAGIIPLLAGLTTVADWIASSETDFPFTTWMSATAYNAVSQSRADAALHRLGWIPQPSFGSIAPFSDIFGFDPNAMQEAMEKVADGVDEPYLAIVEAPMGQGKTEAALYAIDAALAKGQAQGFYIALPTQATANAMFDRVTQKYLANKARKSVGRFNIQLVHSGSILSDAIQYLFPADCNDDSEGRIVAEEWFMGPKRPLLASFGVGTIDQVLMGTMRVRHWFVRLFGLAGKVVVFDEVHAYDVYTSELLKMLIAWLRQLKCTVVLLSATLPAKKRADLLRAWGEPTGDSAAPYPRITLAKTDGLTTITLPPPGEKPPVALKYMDTDPYSVAEKLQSDFAGDGRASVICNTVARAVSMYRVLKQMLEPNGWTVELFHARTLAGWRQDKEAAVIAHYGKGSDRSGRRILVATQVVEQSLDLDFDWLATDIAPVDLVLQRMGRLWRHERRCRPVDEPRLYLLCGEDTDGLPLFPPHADTVYEPFILLRTYLALRLMDKINPARDIDLLVQKVYGDEEYQFYGRLTEMLASAKQSMEKHQEEYLEKARRVLLPDPARGAAAILRPGSTLEDNGVNLYDDEDPGVHETVRAATRLGNPSVTLVCTGTLADGEQLFETPKGLPTLRETKQLLKNSVSVSHKQIFRVAVAQFPPDAWRTAPLLRYARLVVFDAGLAMLGGYTLRLSKEEGLIWDDGKGGIL